MKKTPAILAFALLLSSCSEPVKPFIEVRKIAGKTQAEVAAYLGQPSRCEQTERYGPRCYYRKGDVVEVVFWPTAEFITVSNLGSVDFDSSFLPMVGLEGQYPGFRNDTVMRWSNLPGIREASLFAWQNGKSHYFYVKVTRDP